MARNLGFLVLLLVVTLIYQAAAVFNPISRAHRSAALELFAPVLGSSSRSLKETYEALRTFKVLGIENKPDIFGSTCQSVLGILSSASSSVKNIFYALRVNRLLKCELSKEVLTDITSRLKDSVKDANSLLDFYYPIRSLVLIKDQTSQVDVLLGDAAVYRSIKVEHLTAFSQSDGRLQYSSSNPESSTYAAGIALETLGGIVSLASSEIDDNLEIKMPDIFASTCKSVGDTVSSVSSSVKDIFYALRVDGLLKCELNEEVLMNITSRLKDSVKDANSLLDFYYPIRSLVLIKDQTSQVDVILGDAAGVFRSIKALSQSDGRWRYSSSTPESSTFAVGIALETLGGVVSLASSEIDDNLIGTLKNDILKLFDSTEKYDDGSYYFDEKLIDMSSHQDPLSATSSVVRGLTTFAEATSGSLNLPWDKILGLAKFFLAIGIPGNAKDLYYQIDALALLESNRVSIPLILSLPATVVSLTSQEKVKVRVSTVLGSAAPPLSVKLIQVFSSDSKDASTIDKELSFNSEEGVHILDSLPVDIGEYVFSFEIVLHDPEHKKIYATGDRTKVPIYVTGVVKVDNADIAVLETDIGSIETQKKHAIYTLDLTGPNAAILSANHLQKLRLSFQLTTPLGHPFEPHQAFLKLEHETGVQHIFVAGSSGKQLEFVLDFLGLVENFFYLSGTYDIELTVGDAVMENSFLHHLGYIELDLPEAPEKAPRLPPKAVDPYSRYGPKAEITHIFRLPEKRPPEDLSFAFVGLILLVFGLFIIGLMKLGANYDNFPTSTIPATCAILFVAGIFAVLDLEYVFWVLQLDLFTMLKALGILGIFLMFVGHRTLSHIASTSSKLKSP